MKTIIIGASVIVGFVVLVALGLLFAFPTMWLVNWLFTPAIITALFGVSKLGLLKAWGLNFLAGLLFKSTSTSSK